MSDTQIKITPKYIIELVLRRRWYFLLPFCLALIGGVHHAWTTPNIYEARTLILVEGQRVPEGLVRPIVTEDANQRINTITQQILSRSNLERIIKDYSLFTGPGVQMAYMEDMVNSLRRRITIDVNRTRRGTHAFTVAVKGKDPDKVMQVANGLATSFIDENLKVRESQALGTSAFLESELGNMRERLEQVEENIKNYRKANMGELPEQLETNLRILERLQDTLSDRQQVNREAKIRLSDLTHQATSRLPSVVVIGGGQNNQEGGATLEELVSELETLQSRYTEKHPDIIRLKKQIAEMESRQSTGDSSSSASNTRISPQLRVQIAEARREIESTNLEIQELGAQIVVYQHRVENTPKREQELLSLRRDYHNIQTSYDSLLNRKLEADIGVNMEREQKGEQFRIVDPARLPKRPIEPDMKKIFLVVVAAGLGLGGGLAFALELLDSSFKRPDELESALEIPVLSTIPVIMDQRQLTLKRMNNIGSIAFAFITFCLLGLFGLISTKGSDAMASLVQKVVGT